MRFCEVSSQLASDSAIRSPAIVTRCPAAASTDPRRCVRACGCAKVCASVPAGAASTDRRRCVRACGCAKVRASVPAGTANTLPLLARGEHGASLSGLLGNAIMLPARTRPSTKG
eukprot:scaffold84800_cov66-Phaeocystis_antarctica.AAC.7